MKRKRDSDTLWLPFDDATPIEREWQESILLERLGRYLATGRPLPKHLPLLKLLPSLNNSQAGERAIKFSESEAAQMLKRLGAIIEQNPHYLGSSQYRITIPVDLAEQAKAAGLKKN